MCTVSLLARKHGYALAMNRDELLTRVKGLPPKIHEMKGRRIICPSEPGGGTWIALNDTGATLALINWYAIKSRVQRNPLSRGDVVNATSAAESPIEANEALRLLPLGRINAFRLIGVFPGAHEVVEWRWNLKRLQRIDRPWRAQQWISSGYDEPGAQRVRGRVFERAQRQHSFGGVDWLRRLHRSHEPERGPYSTCMHRSDAATVSYTEISVSSWEANMRHRTGSPCSSARTYVNALALASRPN